MSVFLLLYFFFPLTALAETETVSEKAGSYDYSNAQDVIEESLAINTPSFSEIVEAFTSGKAGEIIRRIPGYLKENLLSEIEVNRKNLGQVLLLAAFGTIFSGLASSFQDKQAGELSLIHI